MSLRRALVVLACSFVALTVGCGRPQAPKEQDAAAAGLSGTLGRTMNAFRDEFNVPALQLGVIKDGQVVFSRALGVRSLQTNQPITNRSLFHMASVSKSFVATAIVQLAERGKLRLDGRVVDYLPYFKLQDDRARDITLRQILRHTSGLPDVRDYEWDVPQVDVGAAERYVRSLSGLKLKAGPGERFFYSNIGYDILGDVIAKVSGMPFEAYMRDNVFTPLGMADSTFLRAEVPEGLSVSPHIRGLSTFFTLRVGSVYPYNRAHAPSSTLHSNVGDMLTWCETNLGQGTFRGRRIIGPDSHRLLWTEHADQGLRDKVKAEWMGKAGLGWFIGSYKGHRMISYGGADRGFRSFLILIPDRSVAVVTMGNSDTMRGGRLARAVLDLVLD